MHEIKVRIETKAPVILSALGHTSVMTATQDFFSGSVLRGIFAGRYIEARDLGNMAHRDSEFMRLFYGGLRFVDAYPVEPTTDRRGIPLPFSLQRSKDGSQMQDLLQKEAEFRPGFKGMKGFAAICGKELRFVNVRRGISLHMSRIDLNEEGSAERLAGKSKSGGIYNYEAISPGQTFEGCICGAEELIRLLSDTLGTTFPCHAGRSRYTQYGLCEITLMPAQDIPIPHLPEDGRICLRLDTPFLPCSTAPDDAASMLDEIVVALNERTSGGFSRSEEGRSLFAKTEEIDNFVGVWGMRRPRETALAAGTVFVIEKQSAWQERDTAAFAALCMDGVGRRREEGFGQLRLWDGEGLRRIETTPPEQRPRELCPETRALAAQIIRTHIIEQVRVRAAKDAADALRSFPNAAQHAFARLECELGGNIAQARNSMRQAWKNAGNEQTPLRKNLRTLKIRGCAIHEYFDGADAEKMPYSDLANEADQALIHAAEELGAEGDFAKLLHTDEVFYEYWRTFFHFARKIAGRQEGGDEA